MAKPFPKPTAPKLNGKAKTKVTSKPVQQSKSTTGSKTGKKVVPAANTDQSAKVVKILPGHPGCERVGGRAKGVPNKATRDVREAIALLAQNNVPNLERWLARVGRNDPARALEICVKLFEFHIPKLLRTDLTSGGRPIEPGQNVTNNTLVLSSTTPQEAAKEYLQLMKR